MPARASKCSCLNHRPLPRPCACHVLNHAPFLKTIGVLGILATVICILLFSSPLSTIKTVFSQRSSESIYAPATAAQCANCALWTT
eukprot:scaffold1411_cov125-Isochrysis_galbana.AAC.6